MHVDSHSGRASVSMNKTHLEVMSQTSLWNLHHFVSIGCLGGLLLIQIVILIILCITCKKRPESQPNQRIETGFHENVQESIQSHQSIDDPMRISETEL